MILYANGDSHTAAAEAYVPFMSAQDDFNLWYMGNVAHPENQKVSFAAHLAETLKARLTMAAENGSSNDRIIRTTREFVEQYNDQEELFVLIGWSSWEREEWEIEGKFYQINSSGHEAFPEEYQTKYKEWVINLPNIIMDKQFDQHQRIAELHYDLQEKGVKHLFFNACNAFNRFPEASKINWEGCYLDPYNDFGTNNYEDWAKSEGYQKAPYGHFRADAHTGWAKHLIPWLTNLL